MIQKELYEYDKIDEKTRNVVIPVQRRGTWCYQVMCKTGEAFGKITDNEGLINKDGTFKADVTAFVNKMSEHDKADNWVLAYYKGLIAFRNPADRVIYIYKAKYFKSRFLDKSIFDCKSIKF